MTQRERDRAGGRALRGVSGQQVREGRVQAGDSCACVRGVSVATVCLSMDDATVGWPHCLRWSLSVPLCSNGMTTAATRQFAWSRTAYTQTNKLGWCLALLALLLQLQKCFSLPARKLLRLSVCERGRASVCVCKRASVRERERVSMRLLHLPYWPCFSNGNSI